MFGTRLMNGLLAAALAVSAACLKLPPDTNRMTFRIDVKNPYSHPMNVTVHHIDGVSILGVVPAHKTRQYQIRMWQAQPVFIVATRTDGFQVLRQSVYLDPISIARVELRPAPSVAPIAKAGPPTRSRTGPGAKNGNVQ